MKLGVFCRHEQAVAEPHGQLLEKVRLIYEIGRFHQDLILKEAPDAAWLEAHGFSADTAVLEIWTEFFEAPAPRVAARVVSSVQDLALRGLLAEPDVVEEHLDFGTVAMPMGRAYAYKAGVAEEKSAWVSKRWFDDLESRTFFVEALPLSEVQPLLAGLPTGRAGVKEPIVLTYS